MMFWLGTIIFVLTYVVIASEKVNKTSSALAGAMLMMLFILPGPHERHEKPSTVQEDIHEQVPETVISELDEATSELVVSELDENSGQTLDSFAAYVNFDVIFTLAGMMVLVNILSGTGLFQYVAIKSAKIARGSPVMTLILLVFSTAVLSAFLDNVTTILLIVPVTLVVAAELEVPPLPFLLCETMASNIGGTATLIGDPPNLIIGSYAGLSFGDFMTNLSPFILLILSLYCGILWYYFRDKMQVTVEQRARIMSFDEKGAIKDKSTLKKGGVIMLMTLIGFLLHGALHLEPCVVAMSGATAALVLCCKNVESALEKIEWETLFFFMGLFILVKGAEEAGLIDKIGDLLTLIDHWHPLLIIISIMWLCGICAAIMNNVSFTAAIILVISSFMTKNTIFAGSEALQELLWWAVALACCLGGNGSAVGAAANMCTISIAEKNGCKISFADFFRYGIPVTLLTMMAASAYICLRYYQLP